jgi:drug/metabolite transporter (DMT)-like permease
VTHALPAIRPASQSRTTTLATLGVVLAAFCWGLAAIIAKGAFDRGITAEQMAQARVLVAVVPLFVYLVLFRRPLLRVRRRAFPMVILFGLSVVVVNWSYYVAIDRLDIGVALSLQYTAPVLNLVLSALTARRSPGNVAWIAGGVTLLGAFLVSGAYAGLGTLDGTGLLAAVVAMLTFAAYLLTAEASGVRGAHPASVLLIGFAVATVVWGVVQPWWDWPWGRLADPEISLRVLGSGIIGTLVPFLLAVAAIRIISAPLAGIAATFEPVFAAGLAWLLLGQTLSLPQVIGGACVVAGVVIAQLSRTSRATPVEVTP